MDCCLYGGLTLQGLNKITQSYSLIRFKENRLAITAFFVRQKAQKPSVLEAKAVLLSFNLDSGLGTLILLIKDEPEFPHWGTKKYSWEQKWRIDPYRVHASLQGVYVNFVRGIEWSSLFSFITLKCFLSAPDSLSSLHQIHATKKKHKKTCRWEHSASIIARSFNLCFYFSNAL